MATQEIETERFFKEIHKEFPRGMLNFYRSNHLEYSKILYTIRKGTTVLPMELSVDITMKMIEPLFIKNNIIKIVSIAILLFITNNEEDFDIINSNHCTNVEYNPNIPKNIRFPNSRLPMRMIRSYEFIINPIKFPEDWVENIALELMNGPMKNNICDWIGDLKMLGPGNIVWMNAVDFIWILERIAPLSLKSIVRLKSNDESLIIGGIPESEEPNCIRNVIAMNTLLYEINIEGENSRDSIN
jgi:hypothetical protein